MTLLNAMS